MAALPPGIEKRTGATGVRYRVRYRDPDGIQRVKTCLTLAEAKTYQSTNRTDIVRGEWTDPKLAKQPFSHFADRWLATLGDRAPSTVASYKAILKVVRRRLDNMQVAKIRHADVQAFLSDLAAAGRSESHRRNVFHVVKMVLNVAVDDGALQTHPLVGKGRSPRKPQLQGGERPDLTREQVDLVADTMTHPPHRALVRFLAWAGTRESEASRLRWADVDLVACSAKIRAPKNRKDRVAYFPKFIADELATIYDIDNELVFVGPWGSPIDWSAFRSDYWNEARQVLPEELHHVHIHDLRHTYVSLALDAGIDPFEIQRQLGHGSLDVTKLYERRNMDRVQRGLDALQALHEEATD